MVPPVLIVGELVLLSQAVPLTSSSSSCEAALIGLLTLTLGYALGIKRKEGP